LNKQRKLIKKDLKQPAALLIDNYSSHLTSYCKQICALNNVKLIILPPNSTQYLQVLDLGIFSSFKSHLQSLRRHNTHDSPETIVKIAISALHQSLAPINIHNSFKKAGILRNILPNGHVYCTINKEVFDDIIKSLEIEHLLLKYVGTRPTRFRRPNGFGFVNSDEYEEQQCLRFKE
ncbi:MAG: hypothetical protein EZS28_053324, partial [Streblomastix strix]